MAELTPHIVQFDALELGEHLYDFRLDNAFFSTLEKSEVLGGDVAVHARLVLREEDFDLSIAVKGTVQVTCDRCLDPMDIDIDAEESDWDWEESMDSVDLTWLAYELIIVNLPLVHSHQDGGCNPEMAALLQSHLCTSIEDDNDMPREDAEC